MTCTIPKSLLSASCRKANSHFGAGWDNYSYSHALARFGAVSVPLAAALQTDRCRRMNKNTVREPLVFFHASPVGSCSAPSFPRHWYWHPCNTVLEWNLLLLGWPPSLIPLTGDYKWNAPPAFQSWLKKNKVSGWVKVNLGFHFVKFWSFLAYYFWTSETFKRSSYFRILKFIHPLLWLFMS